MTTSQQYRARIWRNPASWTWLPPTGDKVSRVLAVLVAFPSWRPSPEHSTYSPLIRSLLRKAQDDAEEPMVAASLRWRKTSPTLPAPLADMMHSPAHVKDALLTLLPPPPVRVRSRGAPPLSQLDMTRKAALAALERRRRDAQDKVQATLAEYRMAMEEASPDRFEARDARDDARNALLALDKQYEAAVFEAKRSLQTFSPPAYKPPPQRHAAAALLYAIVAYETLPPAYQEIYEEIVLR